MDDDRINLIFRYLKKEASYTERVTMEKWLENPDNRQFFEEIKKSWEATEFLHSDYMPNESRAWNNIQKRLAAPKPRLWMNMVRVAATLLVIFTFTWLTINLVDRNFFTETQLSEVVTGSYTDSIRLSDGSTVWLNQYTSFRFEEEFSGQNRKVFLEGEAYFEVAPDENRPFVIETPFNRTQVLGTAFNLKTERETAVISVASGKVSFSEKTDPSNYVFLEKGEMAEFDLTSHSIQKSGMDPNILYWRTGKLVFHNASLPEIAESLSEYYGSSILLDLKHPQGYSMTTDFEQQTLLEVIEVICLTLDLQYERSPDGYILRE